MCRLWLKCKETQNLNLKVNPLSVDYYRHNKRKTNVNKLVHNYKKYRQQYNTLVLLHCVEYTEHFILMWIKKQDLF